jgi:hypothetical protein
MSQQEIDLYSLRTCSSYTGVRFLAREWKTHNEFYKNHITSQNVGSSFYHIFTTLQDFVSFILRMAWRRNTQCDNRKLSH